MTKETIPNLFFFNYGGRRYIIALEGIGHLVVTDRYSRRQCLETATRFEANCFKQIVGLSLSKASVLERHLGALVSSIEDQIIRFGSISYRQFNSLMNSFAYLLEADSYRPSSVRKEFQRIERILGDYYKEKII